jgi:hypothetical protein
VKDPDMVHNAVLELIKIAGHPDVSIIEMKPKHKAFDVENTCQDAQRK